MNRNNLQKPSKELALRILRDLDFKYRFEGYQIHKRKGFIPVTLYRFEEVVYYLMDDLFQVDIYKLMAWARNSLGDAELADRIEELSEAEVEEEERLLNLRTLMIKRLSQAMEAK